MIGETPLLLRPDAWPDDGHLDVMFLGRAVMAVADDEAFANEDLPTIVLQALAKEDLAAVIIDDTGEYIPVPARLWRVRGRERILACEAIESEVLGLPLENATVVLAIEQYRREARHIYVTRTSVDAFTSPHSPERRPGPKPAKSKQLEQKIQAYLDANGIDAQALKIEEAVALFGASKSTAQRVLAQLRKCKEA